MPSSKTARIATARTWWKQLPETLKAALFLAIVAVLFAYPLFFSGKQFSPMDVLYSYYPWKPYAPDWYEEPSNLLRWDDASKFFPERASLIRNFQQDGISFWQTDHLLGTPNRPTLHRYQQLFSPLFWLFSILPFNTANSLIHILNLYIAGLSMWLLLRAHGLGLVPTLAGAVVYMLNGFFVVWMSAFFLPAMLSLLPLILYLCEQMVRRQKLKYALWMALLLAWQFFMGYPPGSIVSWFFFGLYGIVTLIYFYWRGKRYLALHFAALFGLAVVLALALSAIYLIPTVQQLTASEYMLARSQMGAGWMPWERLLGFVLPDFWGNPTVGGGQAWIGTGNYCEVIAYWGVTSLIIAIFGLVAGIHRTRIYAYAVSALILALSLGYGIWPLRYLLYLPGVSGVNAARWHFGIALAGSLLTALGLEFLMNLKQHQRGPSAVIVLLTGTGASYLILTIASPSLVRTRFADYPSLLKSHYWQIGLAVAFLVLVATRLVLYKKSSRTLFGALALGMIFLDLFAFGADFNPYIANKDLYPTTPGIRFLQSQDELNRITPWQSWNGVLPAFTANVYGISSITGLDHYRDPTYRALLGPMMSDEAQYYAQGYGYVRLDQNLDRYRAVLSMLNVRFVVTVPKPSSFSGFEAVYMGPDMWIYENPLALARTWGVAQYAVVTNEQALHRIHGEEFDPRQIVFLETEPNLDMDQSACSSDELQSKVVGYAQDEIIIHTDFACAGILTISERYAPGWTAKLDKVPVQVLRADYLLRAVPVPAGQHTVHLKYKPQSQWRGMLISLSALILLCAAAGFQWKRWRGATAVGIAIPALVIYFFVQPFKEPVRPAERRVQVNTPDRPPMIPNIQTATLHDRQGEIKFLGYELNRVGVVPGETLLLTLYWQGAAQVGDDYTVFTHLLDESQQLLAQKDKPPLKGAVPTTSWKAGQIITDIYQLTVRADAHPTTGHIVIGMYNSLTGERMPLYDNHGNHLTNDMLVLDTEIIIQP